MGLMVVEDQVLVVGNTFILLVIIADFEKN